MSLRVDTQPPAAVPQGSFGCLGQSSALAAEVMQHLGPAHVRSVALSSVARGFRCRVRRGGRFPATWQCSPETGARLRRTSSVSGILRSAPGRLKPAGTQKRDCRYSAALSLSPSGFMETFMALLLAGAKPVIDRSIA